MKVVPAFLAVVGCEYPKVFMGFFLWALWALLLLSGVGKKAQFQRPSFLGVEMIHRISRSAFLLY